MMEADPWASGVLWAVPALCLSRAALIGVTVTAFMSGYGAVAMPWTTIRGLLNPVDEAEVRESVRAVQHALRTLHQRCRSSPRYSSSLPCAASATLRTRRRRRIRGRSWFAAAMQPLRPVRTLTAGRARRVSCARRDVGARPRAALRCARLDELLREKERAAFATTVRGRVMNRCGWFFAAYCGCKFSRPHRSCCCALRRRPGDQGDDRRPATARRRRARRDTRARAPPARPARRRVGSRGILVRIDLARSRRRHDLFVRARIPTQASRSMSSLTSHIQGRRSVPTYRTCMRRTTSSCIIIAHVQGFYFLSVVLLLRASLPAAYRRGLSKRASVASSGVSTTRGSTCSFSPQLLRPSPFLPSRGTSTWDTAGFPTTPA